MTGTETTSWRVIHGAAEGDPELREVFARRYAPVMEAYFTARWRQSPLAGQVADAVQEAFVECFRPNGVLESADHERRGGFRAFLFGVLRNIASRVEQRAARNARVSLHPALALDAVPDPNDPASVAFDRAWARALMREAAERQAEQAVDDRARRRIELLRLRFHDRLPIRDIARRWNADPDVLHREYARARREFETLLRQVVAEHHPGTEAEVRRTMQELVRALRS